MVRCCLHDPSLIRFGTIPACDPVKIGIFRRGGSVLVQILCRRGRRPQSIYGPLDRGMM